VAGLLDALLGAGDADAGAGPIGPRHGDLGGRPQLQLLQLLAVLADDEAVVLLGDGDGGRGLGGWRVEDERTDRRTEGGGELNWLLNAAFRQTFNL